MVTMESTLFLLLQVFSSGVAGYITNKYAVNMIFKEYTPLKIGGAVKKNKEKFIEEISDLVEKDIINSQTIKNTILDENFKELIEKMGNDFLQEALYKTFEDKQIKEIQGWNETVANSKVFLKNNLEEIFSKLINNLTEHVNLEDLLTDNQINSIVENIYNEISANINSNKNLENLLSDLYEEKGDICLNELINKESLEKITRIISCEIINSVDDLLSKKKETKYLVDKSLAIVDIKSLLKNLQQIIGSKTIEDILSEEEFEKVNLIIYDKLNELIKSQEGQEKLKVIIKEAFVAAKDIDLTLFEILPIHYARSSSEYIVDLIMKFIPYIADWIKKNKEKIEKMIDDSILETVDNISDQTRKAMISKVKDTMLVDFCERNNIIEKIVSYLEKYNISPDTSYKLYSKIVEFLEKTKVNQLVELLERNKLISEEKIINLILDKWNSEGKELSKVFLKRESSKTLNKLVDKDLNKLFNKYIKPKLYDLLKNKKTKIISYLDKILFNFINEKSQALLDKSIKELFKEEKVNSFSSIVPKKIVNVLQKNKYYYKKFINKEVSDYVKTIKVNEIIEQNKDSITSYLTEKSIDLENQFIEKYENYQIKQIIDSVNENKDLSTKITGKLYQEINTNLPTIVDGRVKKLIYSNLIKLDEDEICDIAQSFMGNQLKPLSMFGAFLGSIVGLMFGITLSNINGNYGFYNSTTNTIIACGLMGLVGVMTNVIALWMIFCPYEQNKFVSKIPIFKIFSIGYIPSHKNNFAIGMANFIDNELLNGHRVEDIFSSHKDNFKNNILSKVVDSKYMYIIDFIKYKKSDISRKLYISILNLLKKKNNNISRTLTNKIAATKCNSILSSDLLNKQIENIFSNMNNIEDKLINYLENKLKESKSLEDILPKELINNINDNIAKEINIYINKSVDKIYIEKIIKNIILKNENKYNLFVDKEIKDIISEKSILSIQKSLKTNKFENIIFLVLKENLNNSLVNYLDSEFEEEKRIVDLFDGKLKVKVDENIDKVTNLACAKLIDYLKVNNNNISNMIISVVRSNLSFFIKMAYDFANGDGLIRDVVSLVINEKIEDLIIEDRKEISNMLSSYIENEIYPNTIKNTSLITKDINTNLLLDRFIFGLKQNQEFRECTHSIYDLVIENICTIKIKEIIQSVGVSDIYKLYERYKSVIDIVVENIIDNLKQNKVEFNEFMKELIKDKIMNNFYSINLVEISWELNNDDISYFVSNLLRILENSSVVKSQILLLSNSIYEQSIENKNLETIINKDLLQEDLSKVLSSVCNSKDFNNKNVTIAQNILEKLLSNNAEVLDDKFKLYITENVLKSGLDIIEKNIIDILKALKLQDITVKEVEKMHPREIHMLFKSFAGDFFIKLYIYGAFGLIFGVNVYLSIILFVIDLIYTKRIDSKIQDAEYKLFKE